MGPRTFAIVLPETDQHDALLAAEELLTTIRARLPLRARDGRDDELRRRHLPGGRGDRQSLIAPPTGPSTRPRRSAAIAPSSPARSSTRSWAGARGPASTRALAHLKTLLSLAEALDLRDACTASHAQNVGALCEHIARELGLSEPRVVRIRLAGILHDIGKVAVPDEILYSDGPLDDEQWGRMRRHPEIGARILGSSELADIRAWVLASHERPDGGGYPRGLAGGEIPLESRIIYVADAYETMTTDHDCTGPRSATSEARDELERGAGTQFDAEVVEALFAVARPPGGRRPRVCSRTSHFKRAPAFA